MAKTETNLSKYTGGRGKSNTPEKQPWDSSLDFNITVPSVRNGASVRCPLGGGVGGFIVPFFHSPHLALSAVTAWARLKKSFHQNTATSPAAQEVPLCFVLDLYFWTWMAGWMQWWKSGCEKGGGGAETEWLDTITSQTHGEDVNVDECFPARSKWYWCSFRFKNIKSFKPLNQPSSSSSFFYTFPPVHLHATNPAISLFLQYLAHLQHTHTQKQPTHTLPKPRALLRQQQ